MLEIVLKYLETKKKKNAFALQCLKECENDSIIPLITDAKLDKEALDTLENNFGFTGSNQDEEFGESHCPQPQVDHDCEEFAKEIEKEHVDACKPHCAHPQEDEDLVNPAT